MILVRGCQSSDSILILNPEILNPSLGLPSDFTRKIPITAAHSSSQMRQVIRPAGSWFIAKTLLQKLFCQILGP